MKSFFKTTLAVFVALILFSVVSGIISVAMLGAFAAIGTAETQLKENSVLEIKLSDIYPDAWFPPKKWGCGRSPIVLSVSCLTWRPCPSEPCRP